METKYSCSFWVQRP